MSAEGIREYATLLRPELVRSAGLRAEAILAEVSGIHDDPAAVPPELLAINPAFRAFLHQSIARHVLRDSQLAAEAVRLQTGTIFLIDQRTPTPAGDVPPEDIVGIVAVRDGLVVPGSFSPSPYHQLVTHRGVFQLSPWMNQWLLDDLEDLVRRGAE